MTDAEQFVQAVTNGVKSIPTGRPLVLEHYEYDSKAFGNAVVQLASPNLLLRFVKDRGEVFFEVASPTDGRWWPSGLVCELMGYGNPKLDLPSQMEALAEVAESLEAGFGLSGYAETRQKLQMLVQQRRAQMLGEQ